MAAVTQAEAHAAVMNIVGNFPSGTDNDDFYIRKTAFLKAIGSGIDFHRTCAQHALSVMDTKMKTPDQVVALAMLAFTP